MYSKGTALNALGRHEEALESFDRAIALEPDNRSALEHKGFILEKLDRPKEALEAYDRVLAIEPDTVLIMYCKGRVLKELGRYEQALEAFTRCLSNLQEAISRQADRRVTSSPIPYFVWDEKGDMLARLERIQDVLARHFFE